MKIDFTKVILRDLDGKPIEGQKDVHKTIANAIHNSARSVDLLEVALMVNKGQVVELLPSQVKEIKTVITHPNSTLLAFAKKAITDYLDKCLAADSAKKKKKK